MASINQRGARWHVRIRVSGHPTICKAFAKRAEAVHWARTLENDLASGKLNPTAEASRMTLGDALDRYRTSVSPTKRGHEQEASVIKFMRKADECVAICAKRLGDVKPADIALLRDRWLANGRAPATVRNRLALLSHTFAVAAREWSAPVSNPVAMVRKPVVRNERSRRLLDRDEFDRVIGVSRSAELPAIATLALESGMRLSEIVGLEWSRIDLAGRCITLLLTKSGHSRFVPLSPIAGAVLRDLPRRDDGRVFRMTAASASGAWADAVKRAREDYEDACAMFGEKINPHYLRVLHFHDLGHEALSRMAEAGLDVLELSAVGGHRTLSMLRRYTHLKTAALADKLAAATAARTSLLRPLGIERAP